MKNEWSGELQRGLHMVAGGGGWKVGNQEIAHIIADIISTCFPKHLGEQNIIIIIRGGLNI